MVEIIGSYDIPADLAAKVSEDQLTAMLAGLNARAVRVAPCLGGTGDTAPTDDQLAEAKLVLMSAITRWLTDGTSAVAGTVVQGPYTKTTQPQQPMRVSGYRLWPSEIADLQAICQKGVGIGTIGTYRGDFCNNRPITSDPFTNEWNEWIS